MFACVFFVLFCLYFVPVQDTSPERGQKKCKKVTVLEVSSGLMGSARWQVAEDLSESIIPFQLKWT